MIVLSQVLWEWGMVWGVRRTSDVQVHLVVELEFVLSQVVQARGVRSYNRSFQYDRHNCPSEFRVQDGSPVSLIFYVYHLFLFFSLNISTTFRLYSHIVRFAQIHSHPY